MRRADAAVAAEARRLNEALTRIRSLHLGDVAQLWRRRQSPAS